MLEPPLVLSSAAATTTVSPATPTSAKRHHHHHHHPHRPWPPRASPPSIFSYLREEGLEGHHRSFDSGCCQAQKG